MIEANEGFGEAVPKLVVLALDGRSRPGAQPHEEAHGGDDDEAGREPARDPEALQPFRAGGHGESEEDAEEGDEDERVRADDEPGDRVDGERDDGSAGDVAGAPAGAARRVLPRRLRMFRHV